MSNKEIKSRKVKEAEAAAAKANPPPKPFQERFAAIEGGDQRAENKAKQFPPGWPLPESVKLPTEVHAAANAGDIEAFAQMAGAAMEDSIPDSEERDVMIMALFKFWSPKPPTS